MKTLIATMCLVVVGCGGASEGTPPPTWPAEHGQPVIAEGADCTTEGHRVCVDGTTAYACAKWYYLNDGLKLSTRPGQLAWVQSGDCVGGF